VRGTFENSHTDKQYLDNVTNSHILPLNVNEFAITPAHDKRLIHLAVHAEAILNGKQSNKARRVFQRKPEQQMQT
jgi:hypothetical protein